MGKYQSGVKRAEPRQTGPHPIWRGIGCLLMVLIPIISFAAAEVTMPFFQDRGLVPRELLITPQTPDWLYFATPIAQAYQFLFARPGILATLALTFIYIIFIGGIMTLVYGFMYQMTAPSRYGPMDAPPIRGKVKKYKR